MLASVSSYRLIRPLALIVAAPGMNHAQVEEVIRQSLSELARNHILALRGEKASIVVNGLQEVRDYYHSDGMLTVPALRVQWLDSTVGANQHFNERRRAIRLLVDLAKHSEKFPDGHYITGVQYDGDTFTWFGGFADVHEGTWPTSPTPNVVVKRLRLNEGHDNLKSLIHKVRRRVSCHSLAHRAT
jgi:hypothetical protein